MAPSQPAESATITIGHNARVNGYQTPNVTMAQGGTLSVVNLDNIEHTVTSDARDANGKPLLDTFVEPGETASIPAASKLAAGTWRFHCSFHPSVMKGTLTIVGGGGGGVHPTPPSFEQPLFIPKVLTASHIRIPIKMADVRVLPHGNLTPMWTYGGSYPGPTIMRPAGHDTKVTYVDQLPAKDGSFTVHYHGDHHKSADDGRPTTHLIRAGRSRTYDFPGTDGGKPEPAAFNFYHDHRMGLTSHNNWMGLQGMFITTDKHSSQLRLPSGQYDVPLLISNRSFTSDNHLTDPFPKGPAPMKMTGPNAPPGDGTVGAQILANGRYAPYFNVSTHRYRLRLLNGSSFTSYDFHLSDGRPFVQVGTGDGLLPKPVIRQDILLGPAQRVDVVVDFHKELHKKVTLDSIPRTDNPPKGSVDSPTASIMQFRVTRAASSDSSRVPATLVAPPAIKIPRKTSATWTLGLGGNASTGTYWTINGKAFDPKRADLKVPLGSTEKWKLHNASPITHYLHLHEELWHTVLRDGKRPPPWERGIEDTWKLDPGETVIVAARFTDFTGDFMIHCHMLDHEDHGLMTQFDVVRGLNKPTGSAATARTSVARAPVQQAVVTPAAYPLAARVWGIVISPLRLPAFAGGSFGLSARQLRKLMCNTPAGERSARRESLAT